jgi:phosphate transport system protein
MLPGKLSGLKHRIIEYATLVETMINKTTKGLLDKDERLLREVIEKDEPRVNGYDREVDEICTALIAQFEPVAKDLRTVVMILKMNKDLERMADHAVNISESALFLIVRPQLLPLDDIYSMAKTASSMLKDSIDAFVNENVVLAHDVCERDSIVDDIGDNILKKATDFIRGEHDGVKRSLQLIRIAHNLERVADLSTNICEEVIYIVDGKDIKHHPGEPKATDTGKGSI